ncbi:PLP-dependent aminotransferase family protein [Solihabitans fulvus]|uniref:PLP-dependent aminotransferase family protein n=1 Tax=Solihabitans fulvus TaxID=1892852 RepID=A0A5B2XWM7_9PSEU|nr:PLP-dependent aminotransferase family protein [Solihabitans fulvus]KAA2267094.1 PLP-dependent aminotransferase family protein [Solihabitans fulvus]
MSEFWANFGVDLHLELDLSGGRQAGLERALRDAVQDGRLAPGALLPATRRLAAEVGLSRNTVSAAYGQLAAEGYLVARPGAGTEVARLACPRPTASPPPHRAAGPRHDLLPGSPDLGSFPTAAWLRSTRRALLAAPAEAHGYGDPRGRLELRTALAEYLGRARGVLAEPERIVITSGYVQALGLLARVLAAAGTPVMAMEDPGLADHREVVRRAGLAVVPLPVDERGARADLLPGSGAGAVVVTPAHQYPTGVTLDPARRHALTAWARSCGGLVIEDDYDGEFRYDRRPVGAVQGMAPDHVAYVGSASKTLGPALRLAWLVLPARLVAPVAEAKRYLDAQTESIGQLTLADLITSHGYDRHVRACRLRYRQRRDLLMARLAPRPGQPEPSFAVHGIAAGLHALISLPDGGPTEREVLARAAARGLIVGHLGPHWHEQGDHPQGVIVGYATPTERAYPIALDTFARALHGTGAP